MQSKPDAQLLREYAEHASETAFSELVSRYTNLVYSAALRQVGSPDNASEVAQKVFISLARGARALSEKIAENATLAGWLCRSARNISLNLRRDEWRRHSLERQAMETLDPIPESAPDWERIRPVLDEAMSELDDVDYDAVAMRFFNNQDFRAIGRAIGASDDAAQKRVSRALDRLREHLARRGISATAVALSTALSANAVQLAPPGLAATLSAGAIAGSALTATTIKTIAMTTIQKSIVAAALAVAVGAGIYEARQNADLRKQVQALEQQRGSLGDQLGNLQRERNDAGDRLARLANDNSALRSNSAEINRLRDEVTRLRAGADSTPTDPMMANSAKQVSVLKKKLEQMPQRSIPEFQFLTAKDWATAVEGSDLSTDDGVREALSKLREDAMNTFLNEMMKSAMKRYLSAHDGVLPGDLSELKSYFDQPVTDDMLQRYQLLQTGKPDNNAALVKLIAPNADDDYDSNHGMSINGAWGGRFNRVQDAVHMAMAAYAQANNGQMPNNPSQLTPYLDTPIEAPVVQKYLASSDPPPPEVIPLLPALKAYGQANNGQSPEDPWQLAPYLTTPEQQAAFLKMQQLPPEAITLLPALNAYLAAHNGQSPNSVTDVSPYVTTPEQKAALEKVEQMKNSGSK